MNPLVWPVAGPLLSWLTCTELAYVGTPIGAAFGGVVLLVLVNLLRLIRTP